MPLVPIYSSDMPVNRTNPLSAVTASEVAKNDCISAVLRLLVVGRS